MNNEDSFSWHSCTEQAIEWTEKASAGVFGVIIYTGAHTNISLLTFLLSLLFYEFGPGGLRIPQKIGGLGLGLGLWGSPFRNYYIWVIIVIMLDLLFYFFHFLFFIFYFLIPRGVRRVFDPPTWSYETLPQSWLEFLDVPYIHVYVVSLVCTYTMATSPLSPYTFPHFLRTNFFVCGKKAPPIIFWISRWGIWVLGVSCLI